MWKTAEPGKVVTPRPRIPVQTLVAQMTPAPTMAAYPALPSDWGTPAGDGYIVGLPPPWPAMTYVFENAWQSFSADRKMMTIVWAGAYGSMQPNADQGVLVVVTNTIVQGKIQSTSQVYPAPTAAKSLRVVSAIGSRLTLTSTDGLTFYFDVPTRQYVTTPS
jgi:hypothetical protein